MHGGVVWWHYARGAALLAGACLTVVGRQLHAPFSHTHSLAPPHLTHRRHCCRALQNVLKVPQCDADMRLNVLLMDEVVASALPFLHWLHGEVSHKPEGV